jgi:tRNA-dihydrouridine synthase B
MMAQAAILNIDRGAQIIDINMGCPAKKVCNVASGSALLQNEPLVGKILQEIVEATQKHHPQVPVTLKIRTGWDRNNKNALRIAQIAQDSGISMLTIHGRTKADLYHGQAEYDTIAQVKASVKIPIVANGDINTPEKAKWVLEYTGADAIMIGRAAQGRPWIFREIDHYLQTGKYLPPPTISEIAQIMHDHLLEHYAFYGEYIGLRSARKHIGWYCKGLRNSHVFRARMNTIESCQDQLHAVQDYFAELAQFSERIEYLEAA